MFKRIIIAVLVSIFVFLVGSNIAHSETWGEFDNKTYLGGYYAVVCTACLDGTYHDGDVRYWRCDDSQAPYTKGCAQGIWDAFLGRFNPTPTPHN